MKSGGWAQGSGFGSWRGWFWLSKGRVGSRGGKDVGHDALWSFSPALQVPEVGGPDFHLGELNGVLVALPVKPVDALTNRTIGVFQQAAMDNIDLDLHVKALSGQIQTHVYNSTIVPVT